MWLIIIWNLQRLLWVPVLILSCSLCKLLATLSLKSCSVDVTLCSMVWCCGEMADYHIVDVAVRSPCGASFWQDEQAQLQPFFLNPVLQALCCTLSSFFPSLLLQETWNQIWCSRYTSASTDWRGIPPFCVLAMLPIEPDMQVVVSVRECCWLAFSLVLIQLLGPFEIACQNCSRYLWHLCSSSHCFSIYTSADCFSARKWFCCVGDDLSFSTGELQNCVLASVINQTLRQTKSGIKAFIHVVVVKLHQCMQLGGNEMCLHLSCQLSSEEDKHRTLLYAGHVN